MGKFLFGAGVGLLTIAVAFGIAVLIAPPNAPRPAIASTTAAPPDATALAPPNAGAIDILRDLIHAGDTAAVEAIFRDVRSDTRQSRADQRDLFAVFTELHPAVDAFTSRWLAESPQSAPAMTARAWQLHALGWAWRGNALAKDVSEPAMAGFRQAHAEGLALALAARDAAPALIGPSDAILNLSYTSGQRDLVIPEVNRIMALSPNRATLIKAAQSLTPKWGGSVADVIALCNLHAAKVTDQPGYDAQICMIEGVLKADPFPGVELEAARTALAANGSPILDHLRRERDIVEGDSPATRLAALDAVKAIRPLSLREAEIHDQDAQQIAVLAGVVRPLEYPAAVARSVVETRLWADRDPGAISTLRRYNEAVMLDRSINNTRIDGADLERRYRDLLKIAPFTGAAWHWLALGRITSNPDAVAGLEAGEPFLINALVFSNHDPDTLTLAVSTKLSEVVLAMGNGVPNLDIPRFHKVVQCPLVRQMRLLLAQCEASDPDFAECAKGVHYGPENLNGLIKDIAYAGACPQETTAELDALYYTLQDATATIP